MEGECPPPQLAGTKGGDRTDAKPFAGSGSARAGAMISWCRRGEALVAWGYLPVERARNVVTTTYNRAISLPSFSLSQAGKDGVKDQEQMKDTLACKVSTG